MTRVNSVPSFHSSLLERGCAFCCFVLDILTAHGLFLEVNIDIENNSVLNEILIPLATKAIKN